MKEIVIRIEDELFEQCKTTELTEENEGFDFHIIKTVANGTPLEEELVAELLNLWAEIDMYEAPIYDQPYCRGLKKAMEFIAKRISELKGDNKQSRCNTCQNNTDELSGECYECVKGIEDWYEPISELKGENNE